MMRRGLAFVLTVGAALGTALVVHAQRLDSKRARTIVVGTPRGASPTARVDARRTGLSKTPLPAGTLRIEWQRALGATVEGAPLVTAKGDVMVTTGRGEVVTLDGNDGTEMPRGASLATAPPLGSPALLADGTVVFVTAASDVVGVRQGALHFKTRIGDGRAWPERAGALALEDGGAAVAVGTELAVVDADGFVRARASVDEPISAPLVAALGKIAAVTSTGKVYLWTPGRDAIRVGSFGAPVDGAAALVDDHTLVALAGADLVELDLVRGVSASRGASFGIGALLLGPPAFHGEVAYLLATTVSSQTAAAGLTQQAGSAGSARTFAVAIDGTGQELVRIGVETTVVPALPDGGVAAPSALAHTGPVVDGAGTLAFATPEGHVGVVTNDGRIDILGEALCTRSAGLAGNGRGGAHPTPPPSSVAYAGLAPAGPRMLVVACETGVITKISSAAQ